MNHSVYDLTLDLQESHSPQTVTVKRGDTCRVLRLHLADGGRPYAMTSGCRAVFTAIKPDGSHIFNACTPEGDTLLYQLTPQTTTLAGEVECQLRLYGPQEQLLTTAAFLLLVEDTVYADGDEAVASTGEATALTELMSQATEKLSEMEKVLKNEANHAIIDDSTVGTDAWSSKRILDTLCPGFTATDSVVTCLPPRDYPLEVVTIFDSTGDYWKKLTLTHCGRNLLKTTYPSTTKNGVTCTANGDGTYICNGTATADTVFEIYANENKNAVPLFGCGMTLSGCPTGGSSSTYYLYLPMIGHYEYGKGVTVGYTDGRVKTWTKSIQIVIKAGQTVRYLKFKPQITPGNTVYPFEPYQGRTITVDCAKSPLGGFPEGYYNWNKGQMTDDASIYQYDPQAGSFEMVDDFPENIVAERFPALPGVNTFYSDQCQVTVTGRRDIRPLLENL